MSVRSRHTLGERATSGLASWSRPLLEELVREPEESANLATLEGDRVGYVAHVVYRCFTGRPARSQMR